MIESEKSEREETPILDSTDLIGDSSPSRQCGDFGCTARTRAGGLCNAPVLNGSDLCMQHSVDPAVVKVRHEARQRGGLTTAAKNQVSVEIIPRPNLGNADSIRAYLEQVFRHVEAGTLSPNRGNTLFYGVNTAIRVGELELATRVAALEKALQMRRTGA